MEETHRTGESKSTGVGQLVDTMKRISDEKRQFQEMAALHQGSYNQAKEDLVEAEIRADETAQSLRDEIAALREKIGDPVKVEAAIAGVSGEGGASSAVVNALKGEISRLQNELEITKAQKSAAENAGSGTSGSGITSAQAERYETELKEKKAEISALTAELNDERAQLAKARALSASGAADAGQTKALLDELNTKLTETSKKAREQAVEIDDLKDKLKREESAHAARKKEIESIKEDLGAEMAKIQGDAAAGAAGAEALGAELANERTALKAEKSEHDATKAALEECRQEMSSLKNQAADASAGFENELREAKERHATMLQNAKADAAAEIAEVKQRAQDDMKDLKARLGSFAKIIAPMAASYRELSKEYRTLRTEARELAATVAPAVKQAKRDLLVTLAEVDKQYKEMLTKYRKEMALRKKLHNQLVDLKGNIRVFCRLRPKISEDGSGPQSEFAIKNDKRDDELVTVQDKGKKTTYDLTHVFGPESTQQEVYEEARDLIGSVIDGYNVCIFAYGQTGSGKTFTMEGTDEHPGLNRRALKGLFQTCTDRKDDWNYEFEVSVMEIYNENLRDLLNTDKKAKDNKLDIKHGKSGPFVPGLIKVGVKNEDDVHRYFNQAKKIRSTASTQMNDLSSRSHCLLVVYVQGTNLSTGVQTNGKLNLIDLAGSERVAKSGAIDDAKRLKEATNINKSLSSLGDVIHALGEKQKHVPFRNSKLTHLLQDSLGGAAKTLMVVQISPVVKNVGESKCSLNFADRVKKVELGSAKKVSESAETAALKKRIKELEAQL